MNYINNRKAFRVYLWIRHFAVFIAICYLLTVFLSDYFDQISRNLAAAGMSLIIPLLLYEYFHRPNYCSFEKQEKGWSVGLFIPDTRYHFIFSKKNIQYFFIPEGQLLSIEQSRHLFGLHRRLTITIQKESNEQTLTMSLDFFSKKEQANILKLFDAEKDY